MSKTKAKTTRTKIEAKRTKTKAKLNRHINRASTSKSSATKTSGPTTDDVGLLVLGFDDQQKPCGARFVDADPGPGDGPELPGIFEALGGDLGLRTDDGGVELAEGGGEFRTLEAEPGVNLDPGVLEEFDPGGFELVGDQHTRHVGAAPERWMRQGYCSIGRVGV